MVVGLARLAKPVTSRIGARSGSAIGAGAGFAAGDLSGDVIQDPISTSPFGISFKKVKVLIVAVLGIVALVAVAQFLDAVGTVKR